MRGLHELLGCLFVFLWIGWTALIVTLIIFAIRWLYLNA